MGKSGICETKTTRFVVTVDHYYQLGSEDEMETYVLTTGPLSVCIDASSWPFYESGILSSCNNTVNHCVQAVGINSEERYWIVSSLTVNVYMCHFPLFDIKKIIVIRFVIPGEPPGVWMATFT